MNEAALQGQKILKEVGNPTEATEEGELFFFSRCCESGPIFIRSLFLYALTDILLYAEHLGILPDGNETSRKRLIRCFPRVHAVLTCSDFDNRWCGCFYLFILYLAPQF